MAALLAVVGAFAAYSWKPWLGGAATGAGPAAKTFRVSSSPVVRQLFVRALLAPERPFRCSYRLMASFKP